MKDLTALTRIFLGALGIYLLIEIIPGLINFLYMLSLSLINKSANWGYLLSLGSLCVWLFVIVWFFFRKRELLTRMILKGIQQPLQESERVNWVEFGYRIVCFSAGLIFVVKSMTQIIYLLFFAMPLFKETDVNSMQQVLTGELAGAVFRLALGVYLVLGAPRFVRWQVRRTYGVMRAATD